MRPAQMQLSYEFTSEWKLRKRRNSSWIVMGVPTHGLINTLRQHKVRPENPFFAKTKSMCKKGCHRDHKKLEPSTSSFTSLHNGIPSLKRFSPKSSSEATAVFVLHIHGRLGLQEPRDHGVVAFAGCEVQRCVASRAADPRPSRRAEPNGMKGRKTLRILEPQKSMFWKLWPLKSAIVYWINSN